MNVWLNILLTLLPKLFDWLLRKQASGPALTLTERLRVGAVLFHLERFRNQAFSMGCAPDQAGEQLAPEPMSFGLGQTGWVPITIRLDAAQAGDLVMSLIDQAQHPVGSTKEG